MAMRLWGDNSADTMAVCDWLRENGYPWLIGNALAPSTLVPETGGKPGDRGIYLDPEDGALVVRTDEDGDWRAKYGDWVIKTRHGDVVTCNNSLFEVTYELV